MNLLFLAAGAGTRFNKSSSNPFPKSLAPVFRDLGTLELSLQAALAIESFESKSVVVGFMPGSFSHLGLNVIQNEDWETTGQAGSLLAASQVLNSGKTLVVYGDCFISSENMNRILRHEARSGRSIVGSISSWRKTWESRTANPLDDLESFKQDPTGNLIEIGRPVVSFKGIDGQFAGAYLVQESDWQILYSIAHSNPKLSSTELIQGALESGVVFEVEDLDDPWFEIDTPKDLEFAQVACQNLNLSEDLGGDRDFGED